MKYQPTTKRELITELRALTIAIEVTQLPKRIDIHLKEIISIAKKARTITDNSYWLINEIIND